MGNAVAQKNTKKKDQLSFSPRSWVAIARQPENASEHDGHSTDPRRFISRDPVDAAATVQLLFMVGKLCYHHQKLRNVGMSVKTGPGLNQRKKLLCQSHDFFRGEIFVFGRGSSLKSTSLKQHGGNFGQFWIATQQAPRQYIVASSHNKP